MHSEITTDDCTCQALCLGAKKLAERLRSVPYRGMDVSLNPVCVFIFG